VITILVLGPEDRTRAFKASHPSVEILTARENEEALEKLARNRRIDAVLLLAGADAAEFAAMLAEEDPAAPPLFAPVSVGAIPGAIPLPEGDSAQLLERLVERLDAKP
jgi:hypothetical protein